MPSNKFFVLTIFVIFLAWGCQTIDGIPDQPNFPILTQNSFVTQQPESTITATQIPIQTKTTKPTAKTPPKQPKQTATQDQSTQIIPQNTPGSTQGYTNLSNKIDEIVLKFGGRWHIIVKEVNGPNYVSLRPDQRINIASLVKVPIALLFFESLSQKGILEEEIENYLNTYGTGGRTFDQLLHAMLVKSEEAATQILFEYIYENMNVPVQLRDWEIQGIDLEARRGTALDIATIFERFYEGEFVSLTAQNIILSYLSEYTSNDDTRIGTLSSHIPKYFKIYNKRGSLLTPYVVADVAILENSMGTDFIIAIFAYNSHPKTTYEALDQAIGEVALAFWEFISPDFSFDSKLIEK